MNTQSPARCLVPARPSSPSIVRPIRAPRAGPARLVPVNGGSFLVGTDRSPLPGDGEGPPRRVKIAPFRIDPFAVTNNWSAEYITATGYPTDAQRWVWSLVFRGFLPLSWHVPPIEGTGEAPHWWRHADGADWAHPDGPGSDVAGRGNHPAAHVSWNDAAAFAAWAGGRLPTEAEWEFAAAAGQSGKRYPWGEQDPVDKGFQPCNIWQGESPFENTGQDGFFGAAPVDSLASNPLGLHNMAGNVWEWSADAFRIRFHSRAARERKGAGPPGSVRLLKGGSYLCHHSYCHRYRIAARTGANRRQQHRPHRLPPRLRRRLTAPRTRPP